MEWHGTYYSNVGVATNYDPSTSKKKIYACESGHYLIGIQLNASTSGNWKIQLIKDGNVFTSVHAGDAPESSLHMPVYLSANSYVKVYTDASNVTDGYFWMVKIR